MKENSKTRKEDLRSRITKKIIADKFCELLKAKKFDSITVSELAEMCEINRGTFYLYFEDLNDLYEKIQNDFIGKFKNSLMPLFLAQKDNLTDNDYILEILKTLYNNKEITGAILGDNIAKKFVKELMNIARQLVLTIYPKFFANKNKKDFENFFNYSSAGALILIVNWVKSDFKENVHTLADTLEGLLSASLAYLN